MKERLQFEDNGEGWLLELRQYWDPEVFDPSKNPMVMIPGYCMNTFILNFHPTRQSIVRFMAAEGYEVWTANLRGQGGSRRKGGQKVYGFRELGLVDIPKVFSYVTSHTKTTTGAVNAVGCSLGATFLYTYLAHHADDHIVENLISIGGPLRWEDSHPLVRFAFQSPGLAGVVNVRGTRRFAQTVLPVVQRFPAALQLYMNANRIDLSKASELVKTIDDPVPYLNKQIAHWIREKDLKVGGLNITEGLRHVDVPTLCVVANADGIVPPSAALSIKNVINAPVDVLHVGDDVDWFAHADLFINDLAPEHVFAPLSDWLKGKS